MCQDQMTRDALHSPSMHTTPVCSTRPLPSYTVLPRTYFLHRLFGRCCGACSRVSSTFSFVAGRRSCKAVASVAAPNSHALHADHPSVLTQDLALRSRRQHPRPPATTAAASHNTAAAAGAGPSSTAAAAKQKAAVIAPRPRTAPVRRAAPPQTVIPDSSSDSDFVIPRVPAPRAAAAAAAAAATHAPQLQQTQDLPLALRTNAALPHVATNSARTTRAAHARPSTRSGTALRAAAPAPAGKDGARRSRAPRGCQPAGLALLDADVSAAHHAPPALRKVAQRTSRAAVQEHAPLDSDCDADASASAAALRSPSAADAGALDDSWGGYSQQQQPQTQDLPLALRSVSTRSGSGNLLHGVGQQTQDLPLALQSVSAGSGAANAGKASGSVARGGRGVVQRKAAGVRPKSRSAQGARSNARGAAKRAATGGSKRAVKPRADADEAVHTTVMRVACTSGVVSAVCGMHAFCTCVNRLFCRSPVCILLPLSRCS